MLMSLQVRAEDSRIMADMKSMKKWCSQLYDINKVANNQGFFFTMQINNLHFFNSTRTWWLAIRSVATIIQS